MKIQMKIPIAAMFLLWAALSVPLFGPPLELLASKEPREKPAETRHSEAQPGEPRPGGSQPPAGQDAEEEERRGATLDPIAEEYLTEAGLFLNGGDVARALVALLRAKARNPENRKIEKEIKKITGAMRSEAYYAPEPLQLGKGISSPLQFLLTYENGNEAVPAAGVPVQFDFTKGNGVLTGEAITNDLGIAKCFVESITDAAEGVLITGRVVFRVDNLELVIDSLTRTYEFTTLSIFDAPHAILVSGGAHPLSGDVQRAACASLEALLASKGFTRFSCGAATQQPLFRRAMEMERSAVRLLGDERGAKVLLLLDVQTTFLSQPSPDFHFYRAMLTAKMIDVQSFHLYFESTKEERGAGPSPELAEQQAVQNALVRLSADLESYLGTLR